MTKGLKYHGIAITVLEFVVRVLTGCFAGAAFDFSTKRSKRLAADSHLAEGAAEAAAFRGSTDFKTEGTDERLWLLGFSTSTASESTVTGAVATGTAVIPLESEIT